MTKRRLIAIHLPQFHPFKENDTWWGKGFTEWTNVVKAKPRFIGHYQPHLPTDLGFYDLRVPEVRDEQAQLAQDAGIYGFCYYHYWFNGKTLMDRPLKEILKSGKPDFPFMLCWANENWTRAWDGGENQILIEQKYSEEDDRNHIKFLINNFFIDPRYIRINNKPVFAVYRSTRFPNFSKTCKIWQEEAKKKGLELYICRFESFREVGDEYIEDGIDACIEFQPHNAVKELSKPRFLLRNIINRVTKKILGINMFPQLISYDKYINSQILNFTTNYKRYPCVTPNWDNSPRKPNNYWAFSNSTPSKFKRWLDFVYSKFIPYSPEENLIFINAWNEWAEGNHLEPDKRWGKSYLEAIKEIVDKYE